MKALLDTNIIVDALQDRQPWAEAAKELFREAARNRYTGCLTANACMDIHYLIRRSTHSEKITREALGKLLALFELLDTTAGDCERALISETTDYEDAVMIETAARVGVNCIITRNLRDFDHSPVKAMSPEVFINTYLR